MASLVVDAVEEERACVPTIKEVRPGFVILDCACGWKDLRYWSTILAAQNGWMDHIREYFFPPED
jgi:hypothetical protein